MTLGAYTAWDKVTVNANICKLDDAVCGTCGGVMMERDRAAEAEYGSKAGGGSIRVVVLRIPGEVCIGLREEFCMKITLIWNGDASLSDEERFLIYPRNYGNNVERMEVAVGRQEGSAAEAETLSGRASLQKDDTDESWREQ